MKSNFDPKDSRMGVTFQPSSSSFPGAFGEVKVVHDGQNGATFTPSVSEDGVLSWTNDRELDNPSPVNIKGPKGDQGVAGPAGPKGEAGEAGQQGPAGATGPKGDKGDTGEPGPQGIPGEKGDKGDPGPAGADGHPGKDGANGRDGYTPVKGVDYFDGLPGADGKDGQPGADGISPVVSVEDIDGGHRVTITDKDGAKTFDVMDGKDGTGGGGGAQADWNAQEGEPGHVLNRTHYDDTAFEPILWDGDMTGRFALDMSAFGYGNGVYFVKISDTVTPADDIIGASISMSDGSIAVINEIDTESFPGAYTAEESVVIVENQSLLNGALGLPDGYITNGTYFLLNDSAGLMYVSALTAECKLVKIDKKFLPDAVLPDWNQYDDTKPDYVKNRTHYEVPEIDEIVWDGDPTGRVMLPLDDFGAPGAFFVHVSDKVYTKDELDGKRGIDNAGDAYLIRGSDLADLPGIFYHNGYVLAVVYSASELSAAFGIQDGLIKNGTYFCYHPSANIYAVRLHSDGYVVPLDDKYLPTDFLKKIVISEDYHLKCYADGEWSKYNISFEDGEFFKLKRIEGGFLLEIKVYVDGDLEGLNAGGMTLLFCMSKPVGAVIIGSATGYGLDISAAVVPIQIFLVLDPGKGTISVAAKPVTL